MLTKYVIFDHKTERYLKDGKTFWHDVDAWTEDLDLARRYNSPPRGTINGIITQHLYFTTSPDVDLPHLSEEIEPVICKVEVHVDLVDVL